MRDNVPDDQPIKLDFEIVQVVQGRNHIVILDSSGKVYALGDNSHYQVAPLQEEKQTSNKPADKSKNSQVNHTASPITDKKFDNNTSLSAASPKNANKDKIGSSLNLFAGFYPLPNRVYFPDNEGRSIYKIHAFNNTSIAIDRNGEMYLWGENTITLDGRKDYNKGKGPIIINDFLGVKLSKDSRPGS